MAPARPAKRRKLGVRLAYKSLHTINTKSSQGKIKNSRLVDWIPRLPLKVANPHLVCKENVNYPLNLKKELEVLALALIDGSRVSGTKSVDVETPAWMAAADDELFRPVRTCRRNVRRSFSTCCLNAWPWAHWVLKNSNSYTSNIWATVYEEECKAYFCLGDLDPGSSWKQFRTNIVDSETY